MLSKNLHRTQRNTLKKKTTNVIEHKFNNEKEVKNGDFNNEKIGYRMILIIILKMKI